MITIASGLPRSGTSMLMQMLHAGGVPALTDETRTPDASNPRGYWEFAPVRRLREDASWVPEAVGRAVKIVAPLLPFLPATHEYRVLFMERALPEIMQSQARMLERLGHPAPDDDTVLAHAFAEQLRHLRGWLAAQPHIATLYVPHRAVLHAPQAQARRINAFLGGTLDEAAMVAAVDPTLHRERTA